MGQTGRTAVAAFDAVAMSIYAFALTGGFGHLVADLRLWGSAAAAAIAALVVATNAPAVVGWIAIGYVLFAALLLVEPEFLLVALAVALMPVMQRPRNSLAIGIALATVAAFIWRVVVIALLRSA